MIRVLFREPRSYTIEKTPFQLSTLLARKTLNYDFLFAGVLETENNQDRDAIRKAKTLYSSCMNESKSHSNTSLMTCVFCMRQRIM